MLTKEIMTEMVITVSADASLKEVGELFKKKRISGAPVVDSGGEIVGVVTLTDLLRILERIYKWKELEKREAELKFSEMFEEEKKRVKIRDIMTREVFTVSEDGTIDDVMRYMFEKGIHTIPVTKNNKVVGIIGKRDLVDACF